MSLAVGWAAIAFIGAAQSTAAPALNMPLAVTVITGPLAWEGTAEVYPPGRVLKIGVRTSMDQFGNVVSESWPLELGEAKGLRRMRISRSEGGTIERGGKSEPMPEEIWREERDQFQIYKLLQFAAQRGPEMAALGVNTFQIGGGELTWFRIDRQGNVVGAINEVHASGGTAHQTFKFDGFWKGKESVFPKHMEMTRDGQPSSRSM